MLARAMDYRKASYQNMLADNSRLYNGTDYREINLHEYDKGHPYFLSPQWKKGFIEYDGQRYENVDLAYDVLNDKVLTHPYYTLSKIELIREKIASFNLDGHIFIQVLASDSLGKVLKPGFYDQLVQSNVSLYAKREKVFSEDLTTGRVVKEFEDKDSFFIIKNGKAFQIKSRKDLFKVLGDRKALIKNKLSESRISFKKQTEVALVLAVKLYNSEG